MSTNKGRWQFSLKTFVVLTLFAVLVIAWWVERKNADRLRAELQRQKQITEESRVLLEGLERIFNEDLRLRVSDEAQRSIIKIPTVPTDEPSPLNE